MIRTSATSHTRGIHGIYPKHALPAIILCWASFIESALKYTRSLLNLSNMPSCCYRRVPTFSPYGSVCCECAQRPGLPGLLAHDEVTKNICFQMGPKLRFPPVQQQWLSHRLAACSALDSLFEELAEKQWQGWVNCFAVLVTVGVQVETVTVAA